MRRLWLSTAVHRYRTGLGRSRVLALVGVIVLATAGLVLQAPRAFAGTSGVSGVVTATLFGNGYQASVSSGAVTLQFSMTVTSLTAGNGGPIGASSNPEIYIPNLSIPTTTSASTITVSFSNATIGTSELETDYSNYQIVEGPVTGSLSVSCSNYGNPGGYGGSSTGSSESCQVVDVTIDKVVLVPNANYSIYTLTQYGTATATSVTTESGITFSQVACERASSGPTCVATGTDSQGTEYWEYDNGTWVKTSSPPSTPPPERAQTDQPAQRSRGKPIQLQSRDHRGVHLGLLRETEPRP